MLQLTAPGWGDTGQGQPRSQSHLCQAAERDQALGKRGFNNLLWWGGSGCPQRLQVTCPGLNWNTVESLPPVTSKSRLNFPEDLLVLREWQEGRELGTPGLGPHRGTMSSDKKNPFPQGSEGQAAALRGSLHPGGTRWSHRGRMGLAGAINTY